MDLKTIQYDDFIVLFYTVTAVDGEVIDDRYFQSPFSVQLGKGFFYSSIENALIGMVVGEEKRITLSANDTFGYSRRELDIKIPLSKLPFDHLEKGQSVVVTLENGQSSTLFVKDVIDGIVLFDANPSYVGKSLTYWFKILSISTDAPDSFETGPFVSHN